MRRFATILLFVFIAAILFTTYRFIESPQKRVPLEKIANDNWYLADIKPLLDIKDSKILVDGTVLEQMKDFSLLFDDKGLLTDSFISDLVSGDQFIRVDRMQRQINNYQNQVSAFYLYNYDQRKYIRALTSAKAQSKARYPFTEIISQNPLTIRFFYDIARPVECYGPECRSYWADHYRWDAKQKKFILINSEFKDYYRKLYEEYQKMDLAGCTLGDSENKGLKTLEQIFEYDSTVYCGSKNFASTREELNKFIDTKKKIFTIVERTASTPM